MPDIAGSRLSAAQATGDPHGEFRGPSPDRLVRNINAPLEEHFFDLAQRKIETNIYPNRVRDEFRRKAMAFVTDGRRSHGGPLCDAALKSNRRVNVTTPNTVSKAEFYAAALKSANSSEPLPAVVDTPDKLISSKKILDLGYSFKFESTLDALHD